MITLEPVTVQSPALNHVRNLFAEYATELNENLAFQSFDEELSDPLKKYGPPKGLIVMANSQQAAVGCVALQPLGPGTCEMKRLYVRPAFRKQGIAEMLVTEIIARATAMGYQKMVLDTLSRLQPAIKLYEKTGFEHTAAYYDNPLHNVVFMQKAL